jgi:hypothetical protein
MKSASILWFTVGALFILPQVLPKKIAVVWFRQNRISIFTIGLWLSWGLLVAELVSVYGFFWFFKDAYHTDYYQFIRTLLPINNFLIALNLAMAFSPIHSEKILRSILVRGLVAISGLIFWWMVFAAQFTS